VSGSGDPIRYRLLKPIAQYARMRLEEYEDPDMVGERHADYYLRLAEAAGQGILDREQLACLGTLDRERFNIRAALVWFQTHSRVEEAIRLAGALRWYWVIRRDVSEGWRWLDSYSLASDGPPAQRAHVFSGLGLLSLMRLDFDRAEEAFTRALHLDDEAGNPSGVAEQVYHLSVVAWLRDDLDESRRLATEAERLAHDQENRWIEAWTLAVQGTIARCAGDIATAESQLQRSHRIFSALGGMLDMGWSHLRLGALARDQGDYSLAVESYGTGKEMLVEAGDNLGAAHADAGIGAIAWLNGNEEQALTLYRGVLDGFSLSEEASNNLFELKTMIQGNPSTATLLEVVEHNRQRASQYEGEIGPKAAMAEYLYHMGKTAQRTGDDGRAVKPLVESMRLAFEAVDWRAVAIAAAALAGLAAGWGENATAARLFGLAEAVAETDRLRDWPPPDEDGYLENMSWTEKELAAQWPAEFEAGRELTKAGAMGLVEGLGPVAAVR
jgi:tetratricopeptide (TPR) repeat protein